MAKRGVGGARLHRLARAHADRRVVRVDHARREDGAALARKRRLRALEQVVSQLRPRLDLAGQAPDRVVGERQVGVLGGRRVGKEERPPRCQLLELWHQRTVAAIQYEVEIGHAMPCEQL